MTGFVRVQTERCTPGFVRGQTGRCTPGFVRVQTERCVPGFVRVQTGRCDVAQPESRPKRMCARLVTPVM